VQHDILSRVPVWQDTQRSGAQKRQKRCQIVGMMLDMGRIKPLWRDMDRAHAHVKWCRQIARVIFKHGGAGRVQPVQRKDLRKSGLFGLGAIIGMFDAINRIEQASQPARFAHAERIIF